LAPYPRLPRRGQICPSTVWEENEMRHTSTSTGYTSLNTDLPVILISARDYDFADDLSRNHSHAPRVVFQPSSSPGHGHAPVKFWNTSSFRSELACPSKFKLLQNYLRTLRSYVRFASLGSRSGFLSRLYGISFRVVMLRPVLSVLPRQSD
jgi:hypothetical protein